MRGVLLRVVVFLWFFATAAYACEAYVELDPTYEPTNGIRAGQLATLHLPDGSTQTLMYWIRVRYDKVHYLVWEDNGVFHLTSDNQVHFNGEQIDLSETTALPGPIKQAGGTCMAECAHAYNILKAVLEGRAVSREEQIDSWNDVYELASRYAYGENQLTPDAFSAEAIQRFNLHRYLQRQQIPYIYQNGKSPEERQTELFLHVKAGGMAFIVYPDRIRTTDRITHNHTNGKRSDLKQNIIYPALPGEPATGRHITLVVAATHGPDGSKRMLVWDTGIGHFEIWDEPRIHRLGQEQGFEILVEGHPQGPKIPKKPLEWLTLPLPLTVRTPYLPPEAESMVGYQVLVVSASQLVPQIGTIVSDHKGRWMVRTNAGEVVRLSDDIVEIKVHQTAMSFRNYTPSAQTTGGIPIPEENPHVLVRTNHDEFLFGKVTNGRLPNGSQVLAITDSDGLTHWINPKHPSIKTISVAQGETPIFSPINQMRPKDQWVLFTKEDEPTVQTNRYLIASGLQTKMPQAWQAPHVPTKRNQEFYNQLRNSSGRKVIVYWTETNRRFRAEGTVSTVSDVGQKPLLFLAGTDKVTNIPIEGIHRVEFP